MKDMDREISNIAASTKLAEAEAPPGEEEGHEPEGGQTEGEEPKGGVQAPPNTRRGLYLIGAILQSYCHKALILISVMPFQLGCEHTPPNTRHGLCLTGAVLQSYCHKALVLMSVTL